MYTNDTRAGCCRILLVDDHPLVRTGVCDALQTCPDFEVVGEAGCGEGLLRLLARHTVHIVLLDLKMPGSNAPELIRESRALQPHLKFLILSAYLSSSYLTPLREVGIQGFVVKDEAPASLLQALRVVAEGGSWYSPSVSRKFLGLSRQEQRTGLDDLTGREAEVLKALIQALDNQAIADQMKISKETVRRYITAIYSKLGVKNRIEAVLWMAHHSPNPPQQAERRV